VITSEKSFIDSSFRAEKNASANAPAVGRKTIKLSSVT